MVIYYYELVFDIDWIELFKINVELEFFLVVDLDSGVCYMEVIYQEMVIELIFKMVY